VLYKFTFYQLTYLLSIFRVLFDRCGDERKERNRRLAAVVVDISGILDTRLVIDCRPATRHNHGHHWQSAGCRDPTAHARLRPVSCALLRGATGGQHAEVVRRGYDGMGRLRHVDQVHHAPRGLGLPSLEVPALFPSYCVLAGHVLGGLYTPF